MAMGTYQADDLDFMLRDTLRRDGDLTPDSARVWMALRRRIEARLLPTRPRLVLGTLSYLSPRDWTADWHLMSLARIVR